MTAGVIAILAALVPLVAWLIRRSVTIADNPAHQKNEADQKFAQAVVKSDSAAVNIQLDATLRELQDSNRDKR